MARQPITLLHESGEEGAEGQPQLLLAGTASRLYRYTPDGSWVLLHSHSFCDDGDLFASRFLIAQLAGLCLVAHTRGGFWDLTVGSRVDTSTGFYSYLHPNDSLIALGIESAQVVCQSKGFFFISDLVIAGVRQRSITHWSDFESTNYIPGGESQAGYSSFGGDAVVAAVELGNSVVFYTDRSIWLATYVGGDTVWSFDRIYGGPDVPRFPRAIVNLGSYHVYMTDRGLRVLARGERTPRQLEWMDKASGVIFNGIRQEMLDGMPAGLIDYPRPIAVGNCVVPCGWYDSNDQVVWFSWSDRLGNGLPNWSLAMSVAHRTSCVVDHGITAGVMTRQPIPGSSESYRAFLLRTMGCEAHPDLNEHDPFPADHVGPTSPPAHLYNATEDPALPPSEDSWCSQLSAAGEGCITHCNPCAGPTRMLIASAEDYCLKEYRWDFDRREQMDDIEDPKEWNNQPLEDQGFSAIGPNPVAAATYRLDNYLTLFQTDALPGSKQGYKTGIETIEVGVSRVDKGDDLTEELEPTTLMPWPISGQGASGDSARCVKWNAVDADGFGCDPAEESTLPSYVNPAENPALQLSIEGRYVSYRIYCGGNVAIGPLAFTGLTWWGGPRKC